MTFVSVIPAMVHQNLDNLILIGPVMVGYGVHSFQSICIVLMAWCCMICLEDSRDLVLIPANKSTGSLLNSTEYSVMEI